MAILVPSVLLHEFGHAFMAQRLGGQVDEVELNGLGGIARIHPLPTRIAEAATVAAGPAVTALLAVQFLGIWMVWSHPWILHAAAVNIVLLALNMLPIFPLDGGRLTRSLVQLFTDRVTATRIVVAAGRVLLVPLTLFSLYVGIYTFVVLAAFLWWMGGIELKIVQYNSNP